MSVRQNVAIGFLALLPLLSSCRSTFSNRLAHPLSGATASVQFVDVTEATGIRFVHRNGAFGKKWMPETTGSGCAFLDYDSDGWEDILLVNSGEFDVSRPKSPTSRPALSDTEREPVPPLGKAASKRRTGRRPGGAPTHSPTLRAVPRVILCRNNRDGTFADVTERAGLRVDAYGMGVCAGDYDNDGWEDVYITGLGPNQLFRNSGGTFTDVSAKAGVRGAPVNGSLRWKWSSSCAWIDYNRDGWLDLWVCNFVEWSPEIDVFCGQPGGPKDYCAPLTYKGLPNTLYRNNGNGTFTDMSAPTHIGEYIGKAWGVATWDYNGDGWPDLAVTNDTEPNFLFVNHAGRYFTEGAVTTGLALGETGHAKAGMGIDVADWKNDGRFGLLIGNFSNEKLSLFADEGHGLMRDVADETGLGEVSLPFLTFGLFFFDYDLDGWQDAFAANGHIQELAHQYDTSISYAERPLLFHNLRSSRFAEVGEEAGEPLHRRYVLRGCACGDYDNDGDPDIVVLENNGKARLWRNDGGNRNRWVKVELVGAMPSDGGSNRDGIGALVTVRAGQVTQRQWVKSGGSFMSQSSLKLTFGLGRARQVDDLEVLWPDGKRDRLHHLPSNRLLIIKEGGRSVN